MKQLVILLSWAVAAVQGSLVFRDGAYSGLRVRVGEEAPVGDCTQTLADLQVTTSSIVKRVLDKSQAGVRRGRRKLHSNFGRQAAVTRDP